ncbi:MAG TPA: carbohydrate ABC transporter permease [Chloroflexota bacterium]|jgi:trehalose/maltose transport system permease protein|nr:carbohydrate ABC transporter permease [Chloroflexota bacterium]
MSRPRALGRLVLYVLVGGLLGGLLFPFYWAVRSSLTPNSALFTTPLEYWPSAPTLEHYQRVLRDGQFLRALLNSALVAGAVTVLSLAIGALGAYALGRFRFRGRLPVLYLVLSMTMFPQIAVLGALYTMITWLGLYNTLWALILTYLIFTLPFTIWVLTVFFASLPRELEEAAYVDGATPLQAFYLVLLPLVAPGLVTTGLLAFIAAWNEFLYALSFTQTPDQRTVPVAIFAFSPQTGGGFEVPWGQMMAATVLVTLPLVALTFVFQRRILAGLTTGAVKG